MCCTGTIDATVPRHILGGWLPRYLLLPENLQDSPQISSFRWLTMRGLPLLLGLTAFLVQPAFAQGVKDPPNYPMRAGQHWQKTPTIQPASRPTAIRNIPIGTLPAGLAAQGVYKDGKLVAVPRY